MTKVIEHKVFMIQEIVNGVADVPKVFDNEKDADEFYTKLVCEVHDIQCANVNEALDYIDINGEDFDHEIEYWTTTFEKKGN